MNCGSMAMIKKQRLSHPYESCLVLNPEEGQQNHSKIKTMLTVFIEWEGVVPHEYSPPSQTINKECYFNVLHQLRDAIQLWAQLWATGDWQLHHHNGRTHAPPFVQSFLVKLQITQMTQPPYSLDLVPYDFWLFPKLKSPLKGKRFQTVNKIQENTMGQLMVTPTKDFAECFEQWKRSWENYVRPQGAYFEGD